MRALDQIVNRVLFCFYAKMPASEVSCEMRTGWQLYGIYTNIYTCIYDRCMCIYTVVKIDLPKWWRFVRGLYDNSIHGSCAIWYSDIDTLALFCSAAFCLSLSICIYLSIKVVTQLALAHFTTYFTCRFDFKDKDSCLYMSCFI